MAEVLIFFNGVLGIAIVGLWCFWVSGADWLANICDLYGVSWPLRVDCGRCGGILVCVFRKCVEGSVMSTLGTDIIDTVILSRMVNVSQKTIRSWARSGFIPGAFLLRRQWRFRRSIVEAWINGGCLVGDVEERVDREI